MAKTIFRDVDEYIASFDADVRKVLVTLRRTMQTALPDADEVISYHMPTYKIGGRGIISFAAFKQHYSLFGSTDALVAALGKRLAGHDVGPRGTIRFPLDKPVPVALIRDIARFRAKERAPAFAAGHPTPKRPR